MIKIPLEVYLNPDGEISIYENPIVDQGYFILTVKTYPFYGITYECCNGDSSQELEEAVTKKVFEYLIKHS